MAKNTDVSLGPVRLLSKDVYEHEFADRLATEAAALAEKEKREQWQYDEWAKFLEKFDHVVLIQVNGYEDEMARRAGRDAAELFLNLFRLNVVFRDGARIRLVSDYSPLLTQSSMRLCSDGRFCLGYRRDTTGVHVKEGWAEDFMTTYGPYHDMLASLAARLVAGARPTDPLIERIRYANQLITESYLEPYQRIRLVRIISALEALTVLPRRAKAETLAERCSAAGSMGCRAQEEEIKKHMRAAYKLRSDVVHGDAPDEGAAAKALSELEPFLLTIVVRLISMLCYTQNKVKPQSIKLLRNAIEDFGLDYLRTAM